jgi:hypothetical protein
VIVNADVEELPTYAPVVAMAGAIARDVVTDLIEAAELFDADVGHLAWRFAFITAHRLGRLQVADPVQSQATQLRLSVAGDILSSAAICLPVGRWRRNAAAAVHVAGAVWLGNECGGDERSREPSTSSARKRPSHLVTDFCVVLNCRAAVGLGTG